MDLFNRLLRLRGHTEDKTPLEDFTTEILAGILNTNQEITRKFVQKILGLELEEDDYIVKPQSHHKLENEANCIIDLEIRGKSTICFIENKVNSREGHRQLERYNLVLNSYEEKYSQKYLIYCTKYLDEKPLTNHKFKQLRWFEVAEFFQQFKEDSLVKYFLEFLKSNDMAHELTLKEQDFIVFTNMQKTINFIKECLNGAKADFEANFSTGKISSDKITLDQAINYDRLVYMYDKILPGKGWSEIKYGFRLSQPSIFVDIYLDNKNEHYNHFKTTFMDISLRDHFILTEHNLGARFAIEFDISHLQNAAAAVSKIVAWFKDTFTKFRGVINKSPELNWNIKRM